MPELDPYRLPTSVVPSRYDLTLEPDLETATFTGFESVAIEVREPADEVVLNANEIEVEEAWLERDGVRRNATVTFDKEHERVHLALDGTAEPGPWTLNARFHGILNDKLVGFYRSRFTDHDGNERWIATTQFEATHARQAFPCWDEPEMKAVFAVTLVVPEDLLAISNAREVSSEAATGGKRAVRFADTMKMSTYLVAFVIGPLEATEPVMVDNTPVRVVHPPGKGNLTPYALEVGAAALRYFTSYYGIVYPGDKLDLVAIPDFAFGAMENTGCITFREVLLLVDPEAVSQNELQSVDDVVNHELAHMWFGNLVTMRWWNGIWLNEAFATFMEMKATDDRRPDWERWVNFGLTRTAAYDTDSLDSTRPIEFPVVSPADADGMFDVLTYEKGAAVVRMLEQFLGEDAFRDGIRHYLQTNQYGNTETTDLWDAIEATSGQPVRQMMDSWIFQGGYPVVGVDLVDGSTLRLTQERFRYDDGEPGHEDHPGGGDRWLVPVIVEYGSSVGAGSATTVERHILDQLEADIPLSFAPDWVVVNAGGSGFYRVRYTPELLRALVRRGPNHLTSLERYGLVDDAFASVLAGAVTAAEFLDFARGFADEHDVSVWQRLVGALNALDRLLDGDARERYQTTVRALVGPALQRLGLEPKDGEGDRTRELRATLFETLGTLGADASVRERAKSLVAAVEADAHAVEPNLAAAAITVTADAGGEAEYERFAAARKAATTPQSEVRYLYSLARFHDAALIQRTLDATLTDEVRSQNAGFLLRLALTNRTAGPQAWEFVRRNWEALLERLPSNNVVRMCEGIRTLTAPELAADVQGFFAEHQVPQGEKTLAQHLERLKVNVALRDREAEAFAASV
jgi:puromycin-sensitive aminopeptidase